MNLKQIALTAGIIFAMALVTTAKADEFDPGQSPLDLVIEAPLNSMELGLITKQVLNCTKVLKDVLPEWDSQSIDHVCTKRAHSNIIEQRFDNFFQTNEIGL